MSARPDLAAAENAAAGCSLRLPRTPQRGRVGEVRSASIGSSLELHDFRHYHPGDDLRHLDWNAVARTGELVLRARQDEVSPRLEVVLDASKSMAVSDEKAARAKELCWLAMSLGRRAGLESSLVVAGRSPQKAFGPSARALLEKLELDGQEAFDLALRRAPPLMPCGVRIVVSDLLFESAPQPVAERWARGTHGLYVLQVLDADDLAPPGGVGARLVDAESGELLERVLTPAVLAAYAERLEAHQRLWAGAAERVHGALITVNAGLTVRELASRSLQPMMEAA